jgi:transposase-like protein
MTELPPPNTLRWVARRKAAVVAAVSSGVITIEEACRRYQMSEEELFAWQRAFENYGIVGLSAGYFRPYRSARPPRPRTRHPAKSPRHAARIFPQRPKLLVAQYARKRQR